MYFRTCEEVKTVIKHAKLEENDLMPVSQVLLFPPQTEVKEDFKFIELNSSLLNDLEEGQTLTFRGSEDEHAVLCTADMTYEVKEAETSNSMLLIPLLEFPKDMAAISDENRILREKEIVGVFYKYFELKPCKPRLQKLRKLLEQGQYSGPEYESAVKGSSVNLYTFDELLEIVQASTEELKIALTEIAVYNIDGKCRMLENDYHFRVLSAITNLIEENSWPVTGLIEDEVYKSLSHQIPLDILRQCFHWYAEITDRTADDGSPLFKLSEDRVCRFYAQVVLQQAGKFNLKDFLISWEDSVPEGLKTNPRQLEGIALIDKSSKPEVIWYFAEADLPEDINERFMILFQTREKWTFDEIKPYIVRLATEKMNVNALLTKYTRSSNVAGVRYFTAKHKN